MRLQSKINFSEVMTADYAVPADPNRVQPLHPFTTQVKNAGAFGPEKPFVPVGCQGVDRCLLNIERQDAQALNGVDKEKDAAFSAKLPDRAEIIAKAAGILDGAQTDQPSAVINGRNNIVQKNSAIATWNCS